MVVENMPEYPGGNEAMIAFFAKNMKYPADAQKNKVQGRVLVTFVVERDGTITDVQVAKPTFPSLDDEAMRLVKKMPKWKPGTQRGVPVRVKFTLPVVFKL
jgi:protein TonB